METRYSTCAFCDGGCSVKAEYHDDGTWKVLPTNPEFPACCPKINLIDEYRLHPQRIIRPLKNRGSRGNAEWVEISWEQALDEIADRMKDVIAKYGPESVAFADMPGNSGFGGLVNRFANCLGTPNYIVPVQLCMGNTAQVHRAIYGWLSLSSWENTDCIVYFGQDRDAERWPAEYLNLKAARARGAKLIVVDPRCSATAKSADYHLPIRYGTDAALALAWINVIISEGLYDKEFVAQNCSGFEALAQHVERYTPEQAAQICQIDAELIRTTARLYAQSSHAIIPWGVVPDMQVNSTSLIHSLCILRAICGFVNVSEMVLGPAAGGRGNAEVARFDWLPQEQLRKQLGAQTHPLLTYRAAQLYDEANAKRGVSTIQNILGASLTCVPPALFAAMRGEGPYPVKALFSIANNTVMSYANQQGIIDALMNQDLVVTFEHWMTPTAQLSDYVLPGDMWAERSSLGKAYDVAPVFAANQAFCEPAGACKSLLFLLKGLADRLGFSDRFPWASEEDYFDWKLEDLGLTWKDAVKAAPAPIKRTLVAPGSFITPSGKIELESSVLQSLGFSPLPIYVEHIDPEATSDDYPYILFAGLREQKNYNTNLHQIASLRRQCPEPLLLINPADAATEGIAEGQWAQIETAYGKVQLMTHIDDAQPQGTLRIPHGWWKPEAEQGLAGALSGACLHNDGMLFPDDEWNLDPAQGLPNLRGGIRGRIRILA